MPDDHHATGRSDSDNRGEAIDRTPPRPDTTRAARTDDGKGQSDTGRADQTDDKAEARDEAAGRAFDPDAEQA